MGGGDEFNAQRDQRRELIADSGASAGDFRGVSGSVSLRELRARLNSSETAEMGMLISGSANARLWSASNASANASARS